MFNKNQEKLESFIGHGTEFKGEVKTRGTLKVDGAVVGNIDADWVVLGEKALVKGNTTARGIVVGGVVEGNLHAKEIVEIKTKGRIHGDIVTLKLVVAEGGIIDGKTSMPSEESKVVEIRKDKLMDSAL